MAAAVATIDSLHEDMVHDCQFDYYSKKMATCSSDRTIKIFEITGDIYHCSATLSVHEGPVWQISWAHPKFGILLASCSYDGSVIIQKELSQGNWSKLYELKLVDSSANSICWAPHEYGLMLACASSDGKVNIIEYKNSQWFVKTFVNDSLGCNAISWAPYVGTNVENNSTVFRLATGSCDNNVRIWKWVDGISTEWEEEKKVSTDSPHRDWVRDVSWAPNSALPYLMFASCSEDRSLCIWKQKDPSNSSSAWEAKVIHQFEAPVWRLSWSITGTVLAVSTGDHKVTLWKQSVDESWVQVSNVGEN